MNQFITIWIQIVRFNILFPQAFFLPNSDTIITCFRDDTIFAWDLESMSCSYQLPVPPGKSPQYRTFAATRYMA